MTKKDYQLITGVFEEFFCDDVYFDNYVEVLSLVVRRLCEALKRDNPRLDTEDFFNSCGIWP
jgi:hypothetical protein